MYVLISDIARYVSVILSLLLMATSVRYMQLRTRQLGARAAWFGPVTPLWGTLGMMMMLLLGTTRRFVALGTPADRYVWGFVAGVLFLSISAVLTLRVDWRPPWRRH